MKHFTSWIVAIVAMLSLTGCGYNSIQQSDEAVSAAHSQVLSVYKKRADLIPNLVEVVKGYAAHEQKVFTDVAESRSKAGQITLPADATPDSGMRAWPPVSDGSEASRLARPAAFGFRSLEFATALPGSINGSCISE